MSCIVVDHGGRNPRKRALPTPPLIFVTEKTNGIDMPETKLQADAKSSLLGRRKVYPIE